MVATGGLDILAERGQPIAWAGLQPRNEACYGLGAKFGTTGLAYCIRDDRLVKHIVDNNPDKRLSAQEVELIAHAFASLARMDPDFCAKAEPGPGLVAPKPPAAVPITSGLCTGVRPTEPAWNKA